MANRFCRSLFFLLFTLSFAQGSVAGDGGPCDFLADIQSGNFLFDHDRVMDCFSQVPFREEDRVNAVETLFAGRERSALRGVYDQQHDWRDRLASIGVRPFLNDFEFQDALVRDFMAHGNGHYNYLPPRCYDTTLVAFIPINFGAVLWRGDPVIIVEGEYSLPPELIALYEAEVGVKIEDLAGLMVESINGVPGLEYFRRVATEEITLSLNPGASLNYLLNDGLYALRYLFWTLPTQPYDELVLVNKSGSTRLTVQLPWKYTWDSPDIIPTSSTGEFQELCFEPNPLLVDPEALEASALEPRLREAKSILHDRLQELDERAGLSRGVAALDSGPRQAANGRFRITPKKQQNRFLTPIGEGPSIDAAEHSKSATVIRLYNFADDWPQQMIEYTDYACENSDTLIIDLTSNGGGFGAMGEWLANFLVPRDPRELSWRAFNALIKIPNNEDNYVVIPRSLERLIPGWDAGTCDANAQFPFFQSGCLSDRYGSPFLGFSWYFDTRVEQRGRDLEELTLIFHDSELAFSAQSGIELPDRGISCPGKFTGDDLVLLVDGTNASMAYFFPAFLADDALIVGLGGFPGERLEMGSATGGNVVSINETGANILFGLDNGVPLKEPPAIFARNVDARYEEGGDYREDLTTLHANDPIEVDITLPFWSSMNNDDNRGFILKKVLQAARD